jgi:hypothetical protein
MEETMSETTKRRLAMSFNPEWDYTERTAQILISNMDDFLCIVDCIRGRCPFRVAAFDEDGRCTGRAHYVVDENTVRILREDNALQFLFEMLKRSTTT